MKKIDLRSDTVTQPTMEMRQAMFDAMVGDDVYQEDPTVRQLEETAAAVLGKEAALLVTSGTQGNQLAVLAWCRPGEEIILEENSHIFLYEGGAVSALAGVQTRTVPGVRGAIQPEDLMKAIRDDDIHHPDTGLICMENTHNRAGGAVVPPESMKAVYEIAKECGIPVHLDGARLFNAAAASGIPVQEFTQYVDTVQVCLSKGLGAPIGSILAGPRDVIERARKWRKRLGGGMRQAGVIAAPGLIALTKMADRLAEDHKHARQLAQGLTAMGLQIDNQVETNIILINMVKSGQDREAFLRQLAEQGILAGGMGEEHVRFVTNYHITAEDVQTVLDTVQQMLKQTV
ncbi:threonine aldolase family protein [Ectobacillus ponti]|uniref:Aminotransferase class I/II-fold pyridoxal phosphate-dependent enzyme n=1 Tax=Ectobacillus ponti TaxID=2961894 RepID=A0AA41X9B8_9BACI|nr:GntG family PLP-dependent aldolase [Ectobacillus ponti]MCP8969543.1 aminotransferase class I/II-fold pyridoxal phosphate-dependent enzyme [Ectobacillus ponti]